MTNNEAEAHYLSAVLNSSVVNQAIKPLQPRRSLGERDIHRRPLMLPIPEYDKANSQHAKLAKLSKECLAKVASLKLTKTTSAGVRQEAREEVSEELKEIDSIVSKLPGL